MSSVTAHGVEQLTQSLQDAADALRLAGRIEAAAAQVVADAAKPRTPKRTGALMATVRVAGGQVVAGSASVAYAGVIHWGSRRRNIVGRPWITDTARLVEPEIADAALGGVVEIVESVHGA